MAVTQGKCAGDSARPKMRKQQATSDKLGLTLSPLPTRAEESQVMFFLEATC